MSMVRKQVYLRPDQDRRLKAHADRAGVPEAQLLREAVDRFLGDRDEATADRMWEEHLAWLEQRAATAPTTSGKLVWDRDELHERGQG